MESAVKYFGIILFVTVQVSCLKIYPPTRGGMGFRPHYDDYYWNYAQNDSRVSAFIPESQLCCLGQVYQSSPNSYHQCCGSSHFDITRQKCCNGVVHDLRPGFDCCSTEYFSTKEAICCISPVTGKQILKKFSENVLGDADAIQSTLCCGTKLYDSRKEICCSKSPRFPIQSQYPPEYQSYGRPMNGPRFSHEGRMGQVYPAPFLIPSRRVQFLIHEKKYKNTGCCLGKIYDKNEETCPHREVPAIGYGKVRPSYPISPGFPTPPTINTCQNEMYSSKTHICCTLFREDNGTYNFHNKLNEKPSPDAACCGLEAYDLEKQICCNNSKIHEQNEEGTLDCCGDDVYNVAKQQCCEASNAIVDVETLPTADDSCCGVDKLPYDSQKQMCCGNKVLDIPKTNVGYHCCWSEKSGSEPSLYNPFNEICCGGVKHDNVRNAKGCCGSHVMDWHTDLCCDGEKFNKTSVNDACCGKKTYDSMASLCCDHTASVVIPKKSRYESCCGTTSYDYEKEICCQDNYYGRGHPVSVSQLEEPTKTAIFPRTTPSTACCHLNPIEMTSHRCCGNSPIETDKELCCHYIDEEKKYQTVSVPKITSLARCCGKGAYDPSTERCCNETIVQAGEEQLDCCGSAVFDPTKEMCCRGKVHSLNEGEEMSCCGENMYDPVKQICCRGAIKDVQDAATHSSCCYSDEA